MMRPDDASDESDGNHGVGHAEIAENGLARECRDNLADDTECGQDHDIDFGMAEEPEQMLEQERIAAARGIEESRAKVPVGEKHSDGSGEHRNR
jgi:hypothetical protein